MIQLTKPVYYECGGRHVLTWWINVDANECIIAEVSCIREHRDGRKTGLVKFTVRTADGNRSYEQQLNLVSSAKTKLAKVLAEQLGTCAGWESLPWGAIVEDMCRTVLEAEGKSQPAVPLQLCFSKEVDYLLKPVLIARVPTIIYGPGGTGKTLLALYYALLIQNGLPPATNTANVLYCDWESDREYVEIMASNIARSLDLRDPKMPFYRRCILPLIDEAPHIAGDIAIHNVGLVIIDSAGAACGGDIEQAEFALSYFNTLRKITAQTQAATLSLTHVTKAERRKEDACRLPIGSVYFENLARSTWELRLQDNDPKWIEIGLFHRKSNLTSLHSPIAYRIEFGDQVVSFRKAEPELTVERMEREMIIDALRHGALRLQELAEQTGIESQKLRKMLTYLKGKGIVTNLDRGLWGLRTPDSMSPDN